MASVPDLTRPEGPAQVFDDAWVEGPPAVDRTLSRPCAKSPKVPERPEDVGNPFPRLSVKAGAKARATRADVAEGRRVRHGAARAFDPAGTRLPSSLRALRSATWSASKGAGGPPTTGNAQGRAKGAGHRRAGRAGRPACPAPFRSRHGLHGALMPSPKPLLVSSARPVGTYEDLVNEILQDTDYNIHSAFDYCGQEAVPRPEAHAV
jgi:hypothetical protein